MASQAAQILLPSFEAHLDQTIAEAQDALNALQEEDGHWLFELEADCTIPAEYIMLGHYLDEINPEVEAKLAVYIRERQRKGGGWPLFHRGDINISCSVKSYFALKLVGDSPDAPHMRRARAAILEAGGAARCNVFTRIALALFEQVPWRAVPAMPVEIMLLPRWFPFHMAKVSYWSRTVIAPLLILMTLRPKARNPRRIDLAELFTVPPEQERHYFPNRGWIARGFMLIDRLLRFTALHNQAFRFSLRRRLLSRGDRECRRDRTIIIRITRIGTHG